MSIITYKGYTGKVEVDIECSILHGHILDISDVITFQGKTIAEVTQDFQDGVDEYLEFCTEVGKTPDKPYSGKLPFRTTPDHHKLIHIAATKVGKSINAWMDEVLTEEAKQIININ
jgi:predicted HicB family RNase H-like nuclease